MAERSNVTSLRRGLDEMLEIEYRPLSSLTPYAKNARTHSDAQVAEIAGSIRRFGFVNPVLVDDRNTIIAGHGRVLAAKSLDMESVPTITVSGLSDRQVKALILADNRIALNSGWDIDVLRDELADLRDAEFDTFGLGFTGAELDALFAPVISKGGGLTLTPYRK